MYYIYRTSTYTSDLQRSDGTKVGRYKRQTVQRSDGTNVRRYKGRTILKVGLFIISKYSAGNLHDRNEIIFL